MPGRGSHLLLLFVLLPVAAAASELLVKGPADVAAALQLRLPTVNVRLVAEVPADATLPVVEVGGGRVVLRRGREVLLDAPIAAEDGARRAALYAAIAYETAGPPPMVLTARHAPPRWVVSAGLGLAFALDDDTAGVAPALVVRLRPRLTKALSLEIGGKLSGAYGTSEVSIVDRAAWLGLSVRTGKVVLGLAAQYTDPSVDADGVEGEVTAPAASRFGVRGHAELSFAINRTLAFSTGLAVTFNFAEREFTAGAADVMELGAATVDFTLGPEVSW